MPPAALNTTELTLRAPLAAQVVQWCVAPGDVVPAGTLVLVLEAMKMETEITAPHKGTVGKILVKERDSVAGGEALIELA